MFFIRKKWIHALLGVSVSKKILAISAISSFITLGVLSAIMLVRDVGSFSKRKIEQLASTASIVSSNVEASLVFDDAITGEEYMSSLERESDITQVILFNGAGEVFAKFQRDPAAPVPEFPDWLGDKITRS